MMYNRRVLTVWLLVLGLMLAGCGSEQQVQVQLEHEAVECPMANDNVAKLKQRIKRLKRVNKRLRHKIHELRDR